MTGRPMRPDVELVESLIQRIGDEWLNGHRPQPHTVQHEIAFWVSQYRNCRTPESLMRSQSFMLLARLAHCLSILENAPVGPLDRLWLDLMSENPDRVKSALHELRIASFYQASGFPVFIIPECALRTPDFLVSEEVEVECKHKGAVSEADRGRYEVYSQLGSKLRKIFVAGSWCGALVVTVRFHSKPSHSMIDKIVERARSVVRGDMLTPISDVGTEFDLDIEGVGTEDVEPTATLSLPRRNYIGRKPFDIESVSGITEEGSDGGQVIARQLFLSIACDIEHDFIKGIKSSLKSAVGQLSGDRPSIIVVDITDTVGSVPESYFKQVESLIEGFLRNNTTVSRIELERNLFEDIPGGISLRQEFICFDNVNARNPLPTRFSRTT